ncbi:MAG: hypothetical protein H6719_07730 [Sandaracinaceae bacterium]|nr:hypothetical protein [Sandaracinaceae bacterium]
MSPPKRRMQLATPCENRWEDLEPRDGGRYCAQCDRVVVDLLHLTEREAWRRFDAAGGELCVRMREDARGDGVFRHEPSSKKGVGAVVLSAALAAACGNGSDDAPAAAAPAAQVEAPEAPPEPPAEPVAVATPVEEAPPPEDEAPSDFQVIEAEDGSDHPAHPGRVHTPSHHRLGGARAYHEPDLDNDPVDLLDGL